MRNYFLVLLIIISGTASAYTDKPVLININIARQSDTMGFNMAHELIQHFYELINNGKVMLWDSPKKSFRISQQALSAIESSSGTLFTRSLDVFLHEFWSSTRRRTTFTIMGVSFINQNEKGKVSYGYVDFAECWNEVAGYMIDCNVNGPAKLNMVQALYSRNYNFNVVQFGKKTFEKNPDDAIRIRDKAFFTNKYIEGLYTIPVNKLVRYIVEPDVNDANEIGNVMFRNIQDFLNANKEVLFNIGGSKYFDYKTFKSEVALTRVEVTEVWTKMSDHIDYKIQNVTLYVNNKSLDPVDIDVILNWGILYNFKTAEDVLKEKKFRYTLFKLNNTFVSETDSPKFLKSLEKYSWTQVSRYVKFY